MEWTKRIIFEIRFNQKENTIFVYDDYHNDQIAY